jgi:hypothetical protein
MGAFLSWVGCEPGAGNDSQQLYSQSHRSKYSHAPNAYGVRGKNKNEDLFRHGDGEIVGLHNFLVWIVGDMP